MFGLRTRSCSRVGGPSARTARRSRDDLADWLQLGIAARADDPRRADRGSRGGPVVVLQGPRRPAARGGPAGRATAASQIADDPPRYLNTALFLRTLCEISAIILVADGRLRPSSTKTWQAGAVTAGIMIIVSYIARGVAPRTLGRQHADRSRCAAAGPLVATHHGARSIPATADLDRQRAHPWQGIQRGPVRDRGRAARAGRPGRGQRGDRVRRAQDDPLGLRPGRHHRPRGDGAAHRHGLHRGVQDPAPGRLAGAALRLQPDPGRSATGSTTWSACCTSRT